MHRLDPVSKEQITVLACVSAAGSYFPEIDFQNTTLLVLTMRTIMLVTQKTVVYRQTLTTYGSLTISTKYC